MSKMICGWSYCKWQSMIQSTFGQNIVTTASVRTKISFCAILIMESLSNEDGNINENVKNNRLNY